MKLLKSFRHLRLRSKLLVTALVLAGAIGLPTLVTNAGFFPDRPTYDYTKFDQNNLDCNDPNNPAAQNGRCGSLHGPIFNSFINTPSYGDERYFVDGRRTDQPASATSDTISDVTDGSHQVTIRMYVHNNANQDTDCLPAHLTATGCSQIDNNAPGIAHNTKVSLELPTNSGTALQAVGAISASNATPGEVSDTVYMTAARAFHVQYVPGSAKLLRGTQSYALSDSIVNGGALVGNTVMDGNLPGCFDFAALVEVTVNIIPEQSTNLQLLKEVRKVGDTDTGWHKEVSVKPGDEEQFLLTTKNIGLDQLNGVGVRDVLPPHLQFEPGTVQVVNPDQSVHPQTDAPLFGNGLALGSYGSGSGRFVMFKVKALDDFSGCSIRVRNIALARSNETPNEVQDTADVIITKENCVPPPAFSCDLLTVTPGDNRTATFTTNATATNGATITMYSYDFGDHTAVLNTDKASVTHTYAQPGQYATHVTVQFNVNGQTQTASGPKCAAAVNFPTTPGTPGTTTPGTPTQLVNTGPGEVAGLFGLTTIVGAVAYRWMLGRKLS